MIVGGGFAGLACARALARSPAEVLLVDRRNHHVFQPLLYQVATAALSPANVAAPIRRILSRQRNCAVEMGEATSVDPAAGTVRIGGEDRPFDYLVLAAGMTHAYFGHDEWARVAPGLKSIDDALVIRRQILMAFEAAELADDDAHRRAELTFVIVGAGPTGVELAGAIAEIAGESIPRDFRRVDTRSARIVLLEGEGRVLPTYPEPLSQRARRDLEQLGVEVRTGALATAIDPLGVTIKAGDVSTRIEARCVIWAAGLKAEPVAASLGAEQDKAGRVQVAPDLSVPGHPRIFVVGDQMALMDPESRRPVPGVAQAAMQAGRFAGRTIAAEIAANRAGRAPPPRPAFTYRDKGMMATIGRAKAVADIRGRHLAGWPAWVLWSLVHVAFLIGFRNKVMALLEWAWLYLFWARGARLITGEGAPPEPDDDHGRPPLKDP